MGQCDSKGKSRAFTLEELQDLPVGERREMGKGCGPRIEGTQGGSCFSQLVRRGFSWPDNGEFSWGGMGSACNMCSDIKNGYGCDNCTGGKAIGGKRGTVKRIAFTGDITECCKQQKNIINGHTCDPKYITNYQDDICDTTMSQYCNGETLTTQECQKWVNTALDKSRSSPNVNLKDYCSIGQNFATQTCQRWCDKTKNIQSMAGECDQTVQTYCKNNVNDPLCTCLNPPANITKAEGLIASAKVCWYRACKDLTNDNYITSTMRDQKKNCVTTVCSIDVGDIQISGKDNKIDFKNDCASNILKPEAKEDITRQQQKEEETKEVNQVTEDKKDTKISVDNMLLILRVILVISSIICFAVFFFIFKKSKLGGMISLTIGIILSLIVLYLFISNMSQKNKMVESE